MCLDDSRIDVAADVIQRSHSVVEAGEQMCERFGAVSRLFLCGCWCRDGERHGSAGSLWPFVSAWRIAAISRPASP